MSFPRYPKYKESGAEWLGQVPDHWEVKKLRFLTIIKKGRLPNETFPTPTTATDLPYLSMEFLRNEKESSAYVTSAPKLVRAKDGDILILWDGSNAGEFLRAKDGVVSSTIALIQPENIEREFLYFACKSLERRMKDLTVGMGIPHVSGDDLRSCAIPYPDQSEQTAIADFLDQETAKIDGLIVEQEQLIELLKEKRQAVISHAVTKGLNPDAAMKDSGIEWIGQVPAHWDVTRLKYATIRIVDCPHETPEYTDDGPFFVIRTADLNQGIIKETKMYRVSETEYLNRIRREPLLKNDIVYGREGERWGHAALIGEDSRFCLGQRMMQFRASESFCPIYLMWALNSESTYLQGSIDTVGATSPHVNVGTIRNYALAHPPLDEQRAIGVHLARHTDVFDVLIEEAQKAITLLQERRSVLISATVTGQINVRGIHHQ